MSNRKFLFSAVFAFFALTFCTAQTPTKVLSQALLDRFLADMPSVMSDPVVSSTWETATQAVLMEAITNPSSGIMMGQVLFDDVYNMQKAVCQKMKADARVSAAIARKNWKSEFWDVYLVMVIGLPYAHNQDIQDSEELSEFSGSLDFSQMPPSGKFLHPDDMALIQANLPRIEELMGDEIAENNGY